MVGMLWFLFWAKALEGQVHQLFVSQGLRDNDSASGSPGFSPKLSVSL